ncbi:MAG: hypothetical protein R3265_02185, partial [Hyphomonas sp.]|nr:hypothetical protein [Hyphomonas sp.]
MDKTSSASVVGLPRTLHIPARRIGYMLIAVIGLLLAAQIAVLVLKYTFGNGYAWGLAGLFRMNSEANIPALTSAMLILSCGVVALLSGGLQARSGRDRLPWLLLGAVMIFLAYDEGARLHEQIGDTMHARLNADWLPDYAFLLPYGAAMLVLAIVLIPWFFRLDRASQILFVAAGTIFVTGAAGFEILEREHLLAVGQTESALTDVTVTIEETLELSGMALFLFAMVKRLGGLTVSSTSQPVAATARPADSYAASDTIRETSAA